MSYSLAHRSNTAAGFWVVYSRLQAGGFHPFAPNLHHGTIASGYLLALGGFDILLPDSEMDAARKWMTDIAPIKDFDPIKKRRFRDVIQASVLTANPLFFIILLSPKLLLGLWLSWVLLLSLISNQWLVAIVTNLIPLLIIAILAHAKYVAVPKLQKTKTL